MQATFVEAAVILLREGLEAILVLAALAAYLSRADAQDRLTALWKGAAAALLASIVAGWIFERFYNGVHSDIFEGVIIFAAAALLFYVSGWLFLKQDPKAWQDYLQRQTDRALVAGSGWVVAGLAFLAVLRAEERRRPQSGLPASRVKGFRRVAECVANCRKRKGAPLTGRRAWTHEQKLPRAPGRVPCGKSSR